MQLNEQYNNFHFHGKLKYSDLLLEMSNYDFGLAGFNFNNIHSQSAIDYLNAAMGNKMFDYFCSGLPVITFNATAMSNFVKLNNCGFEKKVGVSWSDLVKQDMGNTNITDIKVDRIFIGSCTNGRIEDLRSAAKILKGKKIAQHVKAMVVPGSGLVKQQAEEESLDKIFKDAGFEWREPGCSMCLAMNADKLNPKERCASTSNRNFEGRQGRGGRTHLVSPAMAAAAAINGHLTDVRKFQN